jgi:hypothetical protein
MRLLIDRLFGSTAVHRVLPPLPYSGQVATVDRRGFSTPSYEERCFIAIEPRIACVCAPRRATPDRSAQHTPSATCGFINVAVRFLGRNSSNAPTLVAAERNRRGREVSHLCSDLQRTSSRGRFAIEFWASRHLQSSPCIVNAIWTSVCGSEPAAVRCEKS